MKSLKLEDYEVQILLKKIKKTEPSRLPPDLLKKWSGIKSKIIHWKTGERLPNVFMSERQKNLIRVAENISEQIGRKLQSPSHFDINDRFDVIANPAKPF